MFFDHQIVLLEKDSKTKEEAFRLLADELIKTHCVNDRTARRNLSYRFKN